MVNEEAKQGMQGPLCRDEAAIKSAVKYHGNSVFWIRQNAGTNVKKRRRRGECTICHVSTFKVNKV